MTKCSKIAFHTSCNHERKYPTMSSCQSLEFCACNYFMNRTLVQAMYPKYALSASSVFYLIDYIIDFRIDQIKNRTSKKHPNFQNLIVFSICLISKKITHRQSRFCRYLSQSKIRIVFKIRPATSFLRMRNIK
jgi:hypothetical protein